MPTFDLLLSIQTLVLSYVIAGDVSFSSAVLGSSKPPVSFVRADNVHQVALLEAQVVVRSRVVVVLADVNGVLNRWFGFGRRRRWPSWREGIVSRIWVDRLRLRLFSFGRILAHTAIAHG